MFLSVSGVAVMTAGAECLIAQCLLSTTEEICCHLGCVKSWSMSLVLHTDFSAGPPTCRITHLSACNLRAGAWKKMRRYLKKWLKSCRNRDVTSIRFSDVQILLYRHVTDAPKVRINRMETLVIHFIVAPCISMIQSLLYTNLCTCIYIYIYIYIYIINY
jgi:hypothetical protein